MHIHRRRHERYADYYVLQRERLWDRGSVMVCAGSGYRYRTLDGNLHFRSYKEYIPASHVVLLLQHNGVISTLQQDNNSPHVACYNLKFLRNRHVDFIDNWP